MNLYEFILARITETERTARAAVDSLRTSELSGMTFGGELGRWTADTENHGGAGVRALEVTSDDVLPGTRPERIVIYSGDGEPTAEVAAHMALHDPESVLDWCDRIRTLLPIVARVAEVDESLAGDMLRVIAAHWRHHPDYQRGR